MDDQEALSSAVDTDTKTKCVQSVKLNERDDDRIENNPGLFAAEQTWPTEAEMKRGRKMSLQEDQMEEMEQEPLDMSKIKPGLVEKDLAGLFDKMQIGVVGKETGGNSDSEFEDMESDDESDDAENDRDEYGYKLEDPNAPSSNKHKKFADLADRAREDMDFPDEVDTPFTDARVRF